LCGGWNIRIRKEKKMSNYVGKYYEEDGNYILTNVWDKRTTLVPPGNYVKIKQMDAVAVNNTVRSGQVVKIKKGVKKNKELGLKDFEVIEVPMIEKKRTHYQIDIHNEVTELPLVMSSIEILEFMMIFAKFAEKGIFIWGNEVEEKYLEILNSGEEGLIEDLESYLELKDKVGAVIRRFQNIKRHEEMLRKAKKEEDLDKIYQSFKGSGG
jgi:hypothetical protein